MVLDRDALASESLARAAEVLGWRHELGLPVSVVLSGDITPAHVRRSRMRSLGIGTLSTSRVESDDLAEAANNAVEALSRSIQDRGTAASLDPALAWTEDVGDLLAAIPDGKLPRLAAILGTPAESMSAEAEPREMLAAAFFTADMQQALRFLQHAVQLITPSESPRVRRDLARRSIPLWVDLSSGRVVLESSTLPKGRRVCGVMLDRLDLAEHVAQKATASSPDYPRVSLSPVGGEEMVQELTIAYEQTLRAALNIDDATTPDAFGRLLAASDFPVFAILDCTQLGGRIAAELVKNLSTRLPGISFVLVAEGHSDVWQSFQHLPVAGRSIHANQIDRIRQYVKATSKLLEDDEKDTDGQH